MPLFSLAKGRHLVHCGRVGLASELTSRGASTTDVMRAGNWEDLTDGGALTPPGRRRNAVPSRASAAPAPAAAGGMWRGRQMQAFAGSRWRLGIRRHGVDGTRWA